MQGKLRNFWNWLWNSNSVGSWIVSFLIAFILVRFVFYPAIGLILGTSLPLVVIESGSMEHNLDSFDDWWKAHEGFYEEVGISKLSVLNWPFKNGMDKGDIVLIKGKDFGEIEEGDVIVFRPEFQSKAIIHRVIDVRENDLETKGDANTGQLPIEKSISPEEIVGVAVMRVPYIGWIKLFFVESFKGF